MARPPPCEHGVPVASEAAETPRRRCIASGLTADKAELIRFVIDPGQRVVPDLDGKLPGRGVYVAPERALVDRAVARGLFAKAVHARVKAGADLADQVAAGLVRRMIEAIG